MGAHPPPKAEVRGSNPLECAIFPVSLFATVLSVQPDSAVREQSGPAGSARRWH